MVYLDRGRRTFPYVAYGLGIRSILAFPELLPGERAVDVEISLGRVDFEPPDAAAESWSAVGGDEARLFWRRAGKFLIRAGRQILVDPAPGVEERVLRLFLLGPALAVLLHQRGSLVLHASAAAINGGAIACMGGPGWGKSTLAAALYAGGHGILADDVTALEVDGASPMAVPGFPQLKLWPDTAMCLGDAPERLPRLHPVLEKRARRAGRGFPAAPLPLRVIYVLAQGETQGIDPLHPRDALVELVRHSYCARLLNGRDARRHFFQCATIAARVPVSRLRSQRSFHALPGLVQVVEEDLAGSDC